MWNRSLQPTTLISLGICRNVQVSSLTAETYSEIQHQGMGSIMRSVITKKRLITAAVTLVIMVSVFLAGAHRGYDLGYTDGENTANGWWIDKKSRYYESAEVIKKRINLKYNQI
jgi:hypothetical protein